MILRDYILSAASVINASGGSNGDNPTEISVADCSLVAATLDKLCVEYKPLIIDLEVLLGSQGASSYSMQRERLNLEAA